MLARRNFVKELIVFLLIVLLFEFQAYAWGIRSHRHYDHSHYYPRYSKATIFLPLGFITLALSGHNYYYCDGIFYQRSARKYVIVEPPIGAVISELPFGYQPVVIDGTMYYVCKGVYYRHHNHGFEVIPKPEVAAVQIVRTYNISTSKNNDSFVINIPNAKASYTTVTLRRFKDGFIGPQGEFYSEFPTVEQLRVIYGQ